MVSTKHVSCLQVLKWKNLKLNHPKSQIVCIPDINDLLKDSVTKTVCRKHGGHQFLKRIQIKCKRTKQKQIKSKRR